MTKKKIYFLLSTFYFLTLLAPVLSFAAVPSLWPTGFWGPLVSCTGNYLGSGPYCTSLCDLLQTFVNVIYFGMTLAIFVIAPIGIAIGGILIIFGGANPGMLSRGKDIIKNTLIGIVIILAAFLLVSTFIQVIGVKSGLVQGFGSDFTCSVPAPAAPGAGAQSSAANCPSYTDQTSCQNNGCTWNGGDINTPPSCNSSGAASGSSGTCSTLQDVQNNTGCPAGQTCIQDVDTGQIYCASLH